ncbi:MAG: putative metal-binding motif-containing protein [Myxococcota bacterium]
MAGRRTLGRLGLALLWACGGDGGGPTTTHDLDPRAIDADQDGFAEAFDCNDGDPSVFPGAPDPPYDGVDSDCAGDSDFDVDEDGVDVPADCDDENPLVRPGADELCNGIDDDCNDRIDDEAVDAVRLFVDNDGDGFGVKGLERMGCEGDAGTARFMGDCDDENDQRFPGLAEVCDGLDNDCNMLVDDALTEIEAWPDLDGDGFGDASAAPMRDCAGPPMGFVDNALDCADFDPYTFPGAADIACDGLDNDCLPNTFEPGEVRLDGVVMASVGEALAAAESGSTVELCEGRYVEPGLTIHMGLTLTGAGSAVTVLDGDLSAAVLRVNTTEPVTLSGLMLTRGTGRTFQGYRTGGGLHVVADGEVTGTDLDVVDNQAEFGGGIWMGERTSLRLVNSWVRDNLADDTTLPGTGDGGGVYAEIDNTIELVDTVVESNEGHRCGGARIGRTSTVEGTGNALFYDNVATGLGGGGACTEVEVTLRNLTFRENESSNIAGGIAGLTPLVLESVTLEGNVATLGGGGLHLVGGTESRISDSLITGNTTSDDGGGLWLGCSLRLERSEVSSNTEDTFALNQGGGIFLWPGDVLTVVDTVFLGNSDADIGFDSSAFNTAGLTDFVCMGSSEVCL